jgi:NNP family nitrate/nitrite transporter-like MFS transporter
MEFGIPALWRNIYDLRLVSIRTFHLAWGAFFICLVAWTGFAPITGLVQEEMGLSDTQVAWILLGTLSCAIVARPLTGFACDMFGPRQTYAWLLLLGSGPVIFSAFAWNFETLFISRLLVGLISGSFVVTIYHVTMLFSPNVVGQANGTATGWGNVGPAVMHFVIPFIIIGSPHPEGVDYSGWRAVMIISGIFMLILGISYLKFTQDTTRGSFKELRKKDMIPSRQEVIPTWRRAVRDRRIWVLFVIYGACVGLEIIVISFGGLFFIQVYDLNIIQAGVIIGWFGLMNIFARTLGGMIGDHFGRLLGLSGRSLVLFVCLFLEGVALIAFSQVHDLLVVVILLMMFSIFTQMTEGATYAVTPFMKQGAPGASSGIIGAGGLVGALLAGLCFRDVHEWGHIFLVLGILVVSGSFLTVFLQFSPGEENAERVAFAIGSFEQIKKDLVDVKKSLEAWQERRRNWHGWKRKLADVRIRFLRNRMMRLEDLIEEGMITFKSREETPPRMPHLRIVWDATQE